MSLLHNIGDFFFGAPAEPKQENAGQVGGPAHPAEVWINYVYGNMTINYLRDVEDRITPPYPLPNHLKAMCLIHTSDVMILSDWEIEIIRSAVTIRKELQDQFVSEPGGGYVSLYEGLMRKLDRIHRTQTVFCKQVGLQGPPGLRMREP